MSDFLADRLASILGNIDEKKMNEAINKASEILKKHDKEEILEAIKNKDLSKITNDPPKEDIFKMIDSLPEDKKSQLWEKFNSPEIQEAMKKDKSEATKMLKDWIEETKR